MSKPLTIGFLARAADVNIETIRYYQRVGLIKEPEKPGTGYRMYSDDVVDRIRFIKRAQSLGFSLNEIGELLELGDGHCSDIRVRAEQKCDHIEQQIKDLRKLRKVLADLILTCQKKNDDFHCPIVEALSGKR
ncbi:MAG: Hg(II)-responsive transcriptional regulator [Gammaproteobacteria bacterium]